MIRAEELKARFAHHFEEALPEAARRTILLNALAVFSRKGLAAAKISDIAEQAGFSQGYIYRYYKSKDELFTKLVEIAGAGSEDAVRCAFEGEGSPQERLTALTEAFLSPDSLALNHWRLVLIQAASPDAIPADARRILQETAGNPVEQLVRLIREGQEAGEFIHDDPLMLAITYFSVVLGLAITRIQYGERLPFPAPSVILRFLTGKGEGA
ncbi:TetR/AcrR family transcriptional regulator [Gorillibacterium sp. CAU 1737]|uniref:TetR/AcrR family transcriptional regulator n=1 Tax=Gorillibacterium sp. CAU 1737 TaxID=3140362 RepID=UPI003261B2BC